MSVIGRRHTSKHTGTGTVEAGRSVTRILHGFMTDFQQNPVLRINILRFPGGNSEKLGIEHIRPFDDAQALGINFPRRIRIRIIKIVHVPAFVVLLLGDAIHAVVEIVPERLRTVGFSRIAATHANDGNGFLRRFFVSRQLTPECLDFLQGIQHQFLGGLATRRFLLAVCHYCSRL